VFYIYATNIPHIHIHTYTHPYREKGACLDAEKERCEVEGNKRRRGSAGAATEGYGVSEGIHGVVGEARPAEQREEERGSRGSQGLDRSLESTEGENPCGRRRKRRWALVQIAPGPQDLQLRILHSSPSLSLSLSLEPSLCNFWLWHVGNCVKKCDSHY
jgi:hypothetical protein